MEAPTKPVIPSAAIQPIIQPVVQPVLSGATTTTTTTSQGHAIQAHLIAHDQQGHQVTIQEVTYLPHAKMDSWQQQLYGSYFGLPVKATNREKRSSRVSQSFIYTFYI